MIIYHLLSMLFDNKSKQGAKDTCEAFCCSCQKDLQVLVVNGSSPADDGLTAGGLLALMDCLVKKTLLDWNLFDSLKKAYTKM